jgi:hypothetical protein
MSCAKPIAFETLVAWWTRDLPEEEASSVEEHLFACDACAATSEKLASLAEGLGGLVPPVISHAHRDRLVAEGKRVRFTPCEADGRATAHFAAGVDFLVHGLRGDLSRAESVDVEVMREDGTTLVAIEHAPFDRDAGEVLIACQRHYEYLHAPGANPTFRVFASEAGERRRVGDYYVEHIWR